jgi:pimeloyl-ACP methyl ester carboxylesterase
MATGFTQGEPGIYFETHGAVGPKVLLVMGLGMRGALWRPQIDDLAKDHQLATYDHRGIGKSGVPARPFTMREMAFDALRVAGALGWERFHLVGVSMGGMVSQEVAIRAAERIASLTLIATHPGGPTGMVPTAMGFRAFASALLGPAAGRVAAFERLLYPDAWLASVDRDALAKRVGAQLGDPAPRRTVLMQLGAVARFDSRARLGEITAPTLVVRPGLDVLVRPTHSDALSRGIPGARLLAYDDAGHGVAFQHAAPLSRAIREHVAAIEPAPIARRDVAAA